MSSSEIDPVNRVQIQDKADRISHTTNTLRKGGSLIIIAHSALGGGCRIHRLLLYKGVRLPNESPEYDTKQCDGEVPAMLEL